MTVAGSGDQPAPGPLSRWVPRLARWGYFSKGVVYGVVGLIALRAAIGSGHTANGSRNALREIQRQPFGRIMLLTVAVGLLGFVIWRLVQAILDADAKGRSPGGIAQRLAFLASGLVYGGLALSALGLLTGLDLGGNSHEREWASYLLQLPLGRWLVAIVGLTIVVVGVTHFFQAYRMTFMRKYQVREMNDRQRELARYVGRAGLSARGVTFLLIGGFFLAAAVYIDPAMAKGLGDISQGLLSQPYGPWLLGTVAVGFLAYSAHCFLRARYRHFARAMRQIEGRGTSPTLQGAERSD